MIASRRMGGYTLIEVLVAMSILAMTLTVIFRTFSAGLTNVRVSGDYARAVLLAENRLAVTSTDSGLRPGRADGIVDDRFAWVSTVERFLSPPASSANEDRPVTAYKVTVDVDWIDHGRSRKVSLATVRLAMPDGETT